MKAVQRDIITDLHVEVQKSGETRNEFIERLIEERAKFLKDYLVSTGMDGYVLGLSGGVDSFVASMLIKEARIPLISISLPYGRQKDMEDVHESVDVIEPDQFIVHNIKLAVDAHKTEIYEKFGDVDESKLNLFKGNIMARERMAVQYSYGMLYNSLVVGTDHATEAVVGFYTKFGDGAADVMPLAGLTKDMIYDMAKFLNAPECIMDKAPSAGLWENQTDEDELGIKYSDICDYLNGKSIDVEVENKIENKYVRTEHKRQLPITSDDNWWKWNGKDDIIVVDCQYDFIDGSLACQDSEQAVENIIKFINADEEKSVFYTTDLHPADHSSFGDFGGMWPPHCVIDTLGAQIHSRFYNELDGLQSPYKGINVFVKGTNKDKEQYSGYEAYTQRDNGDVSELLKEEINRNVIVCGIATEVCVKNTVKDLVDNGFNVKVLKDGLAYVDKAGHEETLKEFESWGVELI